MTSRTTLGADQHTIPLFYACYLLRSIKSKSSRSTYVGSTPDPPRRLRQHNGELTQGASKTRRGRPWVMTMIVHGFPSKLAALQFEWAWQHPYMSRHLRISQTNRGKETYSQIFKRDSQANYLRTKILVARTMLHVAPYSTWPLHIKIFTQEAKNIWDEIHRLEIHEPLPEGLTVSVELEGVDGRAYVPVSQRSQMRMGPIDVKDTKFNSSHIHKYQSLVNKKAQLSCSVCSSEIEVKRMDHLRVALCPQGDCNAVAHLDCLAQSFSKHPSNPPGLIPRGGICEVCEHYTLWGDVIRGCYRRARGGLQQPASEHEPEDDDEEASAHLADDLSRHLETLHIGGSPQKAPSDPIAKATTSKSRTRPTRATKRSAQKARAVDSDVEDFAAEMDAIECDTEDSGPTRPSRKQQSSTTGGLHAPKSVKAKNVPDNHGKDRDIDEIVREALGNLSISSPGEILQAHSTKSSPDVARKSQKSTKPKNRVECADEARTGRTVNPKGSKHTTPNIAPTLKGRRASSLEYIDLEGI
ncbi:unnamed protein product [Rhizoctonia solani]|uniref:GIY-YIG domain-containing protein n=1 Tax=Rhizoctonia solani TaxID=456999 RepID=A0A8H2WD12_9AGAM|nr:unnamed protein product [Rhizoctonia solani]